MQVVANTFVASCQLLEFFPFSLWQHKLKKFSILPSYNCGDHKTESTCARPNKKTSSFDIERSKITLLTETELLSHGLSWCPLASPWVWYKDTIYLHWSTGHRVKHGQMASRKQLCSLTVTLFQLCH